MRQARFLDNGASKRSKRSLWLIALSLCLFAAAFSASCGKDLFSKDTVNTPYERYLRAVFVLQQVSGGPAGEEAVHIAERIKRSDAAESLLHHPDKIFVLRSIATDLAAVGRDREAFPDAPLFEAYARISLGEYAEARDLLMNYVVEHDHQPRRYDVLCRILEMTGDNETLLLISAEWKERDPSCRQARIQYEWTARFRSARYAEAKNIMLRGESCMGPRAYVYAAAAAQAEGREGEAQSFLRAARENVSPETVDMLWRQLSHSEE